MSRDSNNTRQNRRLEQIQKTYDAQDDEAMGALLRTPEGRQVAMRLARNYGWMGQTWDANSERLSSFNAGRQSAAIDLMAWAERVAPEEFHTGLREVSDRDKAMNEVKAAALIEPKEQDDG